MEDFGNGNFEYHEHDFQTNEGRELARRYNIEGVPTVLINAEITLGNPNEKEIRQEIEKWFKPTIKAFNERFVRESGSEVLLKHMVSFER
jgi:hypothetical protein